MSLPVDYHMHTYLCRHAVGKPVDYAAQALAVGLTEIGFSDHAPMPVDDYDDWRMNPGQLDAYVAMVRQAQQDFPQLTIKLGLEVDFLPGQDDWVRDLAARHSWDYLIGSVHYVDEHWDVDNPKKLSEWDKHDPFEVWSIYFERLTMAAATGLFNIIGHADLPKKFNRRPAQDCTPLFTRFLEAARQTQTAIEINTAGLRKDCHELYPGQPFVQLAARHEVLLTFGSDAHAPEEVGLNLAEAAVSARQAGYTRYCRFTQRQRQMTLLG